MSAAMKMMFDENQVPEKSRWHQWLELDAFGLEDAKLECNGMSWAISHLLDRAGIKHECMAGYVERRDTNEAIAPHYWVELEDGWIIDLCLRMWLGDEDAIPHGVFHPNEARQAGIEYFGEPEDRSGFEYGLPFLDCLTDGLIHQVQFSHPDDV